MFRDLLLQKLQNEGNYNAIWWLLSFLVRKEKEFIKEFCHFLKRFHNSNESIEGTIGNAADMIMELLDCGKLSLISVLHCGNVFYV